MTSLNTILAPQWRSPGYWIEIGSIAGFTALLSAASVLSDLELSGMTIVWWPAAIPVLLYWSQGVNRWPAILLGYLIHYYCFYPSDEFFLIEYAWLLALANTVEAIPLVLLLRHLKVKAPFFNWRDSMLFLAIGVLPVGVLTSLVAVSLFVTENFESTLIESIWWYAGNLLAVLLVVPFVVSFQSGSRHAQKPQKVFHWTILSIVSVLLGILSFFPVFVVEAFQLPFSLIFLPVYLLASFFLGIKGVATVNFIGGVMAVMAYSLGESPWPSADDLTSLYSFWAFMLSIPALFLVVGAYADKRRFA